MKIGKNSTPQRTALIYAFFGVLWILISDLVLQLSPFPPPFKYLIIETLKGWFFRRPDLFHTAPGSEITAGKTKQNKLSGGVDQRRFQRAHLP